MRKLIAAILCLFLLLQPLAAQAEGYYFHDDHLGGASVVTDEEGDVTAVYDYYPYGETYREVVYDEDFDNSRKFTDQEEDSETGLYYCGARYYGVGVGRFHSQDPAVYDERLLENLANPQALNTYSYVLNNPVKYTDPSGEYWETVLDLAFLAISTMDFYDDPGLVTGAFFVGDLFGAVLPIPAVAGYVK